MSTNVAKLKARCRELVTQGLYDGPCSGKGVTREKLEALILDYDGVLPRGVVAKYSVGHPTLPLPRELLYHEILPQLSIGEIYRYCSTNREAEKLCDDVNFWRNYLIDYNHEEIQAVFLDAARHNNLAFVRILVNNAAELDLVVDDRTIRSAYYLFAQLHNTNARVFLSEQLKSRKVKGLITQEEFDRIDGLIKDVAEDLRDKDTVLERLKNTSLITKLQTAWREIINSKIGRDYPPDRLFELLGGDVLRLLILKSFTPEEPRDGAYIISQLVKDLIGPYVERVTIGTIDELRTTLKSISQYSRGSKVLLSRLIIEKASYDVYVALEPLLRNDLKISTSDRRLWYRFYQSNNISANERHSLMETAYLAISASEWYQKLKEFSEEEQQNIIRFTLHRARIAGYTAWHDEASRLVDEQTTQNDAFSADR